MKRNSSCISVLIVFPVNSVMAPVSSEMYSIFLDESVSKLHFIFLLHNFDFIVIFHLVKYVSWYKENLV